MFDGTVGDIQHEKIVQAAEMYNFPTGWLFYSGDDSWNTFVIK